LAAGACVGGGAILFACALLLLTGWLRILPAAEGSSVGAAVRITAFLAPAALWEELLCRGYLLTAVRDGIGVRGAVLLTSVAFGLMHVINVGATVESIALVTLAGIFLAAVRVVYDSLYAAWTAHLAWNWVMAVPLHAAVSGLRLESPDYRTVSAGPEWITGGTWGPEGGVMAGLGMIAGIAYLYTRRRREES
jgi:membrane protease YdiL (CAAX protease family)